MISLISLLIVAALLQCAPSNAHIIGDKEETTTMPPRRRGLEKFVRIPGPLKTIRYTDSRVVIECEAMGNPAPSVVWMKNGVPITDFEEETNEIMSTSPSSIARLTSKLVLESGVSGDVFTCVAVSGLKEVSASTVYEEDEFDSLPTISKPIITTSYREIFQPIGTSITLPCRVFSISHFQVIWVDNHDKIVYGNPRIRVLPSGDLHINNLVWEDMGSYTCTVKDIYGKDAASTFLYPNKP